MKVKNIFICLLLIIVCLTTGCFRRDKMEDIKILTTSYSIEYIAEYLYGDFSTITSIYPKGVDINQYTLTDKQIKDDSSYDLFIYNGLSNEINYAIKFLNHNQNMKIIDASYGIDYDKKMTELWLNPGNMLMMADNIKTELESYISSPYLIEGITTKYSQFKLDMSELDSYFKKVALNSTNKKIITSTEDFKFIEKYGFEVINLTENGVINEKNMTTAKTLLSNKTLSYVYVLESEEIDERVEKLISDTKSSKLVLKSLETISDNDLNNNNDYIIIMKENIDNISLETY